MKQMFALALVFFLAFPVVPQQGKVTQEQFMLLLRPQKKAVPYGYARFKADGKFYKVTGTYYNVRKP